MIRLYDFDEVRPEEILNRDIRAEADVEATVDAIIADVRARGDAALIEYAAKFDHAELTDVRVSQAEIDEAFAELEKTDPEFITTLKMAAGIFAASMSSSCTKISLSTTPPASCWVRSTPPSSAPASMCRAARLPTPRPF